MTNPNPVATGTYGYNNTAQRWYDTGTGRFVSEQAVTDEMRVHQQATYNVLDNLTTQLYRGQLTLEQWQIGVAYELKDAHLAQAMYAVGGKNNMTQANYGRVGGTLADEYRYLANFANDIASGNVSEAQALARIKQYGIATQQSFWREYDINTPDNEEIWWDLAPGDNCRTSGRGYGCVEKASGSPYRVGELDAHPGDGGATCHGNCRCTLRRTKRRELAA